MDLNDDEISDLLVVDPGCGNWVALGTSTPGAYTPEVWEALLPAMPPKHYLDVTDLDGDGEAEVVASTNVGLQVARLDQAATDPVSLRLTGATEINIMLATTLLLPGGRRAGEWLFQRGGPFVPFSFEEGVLSEGDVVEQMELQLLKTFEGYDQLQSLSLPGCDDFGVGVGVFSQHPEVPRRLNLLQWRPDGYAAPEVRTRGHQVFLAAAGDRAGTRLVGVVSASDDMFFLEVFEHSACGELTPIASAEIGAVPGFSVRAVLPESVLQSGERMLALGVPEGVAFQYIADSEMRRWTLSSGDASIREDRFALGAGKP